jgi:hypothetical protein
MLRTRWVRDDINDFETGGRVSATTG